MDEDAVNLFASDDGSFQLGADVGVAIGPVGRSVEADVGATASAGSGGLALASIYTYSLSKGLYAGVSFDGKVIVTRNKVNEKFYGQEITAKELLSGEVPTPPAAQPLYDALKRCHVYASGGKAIEDRDASRADWFIRDMAEYGDASSGNGGSFNAANVTQTPASLLSVPQPPAPADQHSYTFSATTGGGNRGAY